MNEFAVINNESAPAALSRQTQRHDFADRPANGGRDVRRVAPPLQSIRAVQPTLQAKLTVSHPQDGAELEADRVADAVMSMPEPTGGARADRACADCEGEAQRMPEEEEAKRMPDEEEAQRMPDEEEAQRMPDDEEAQRAPNEDEEAQRAPNEDEDKVAAKSNGDSVPRVGSGLESEIRGMNGGGAPLPAQAREFFEPRMGADLSGVRVHTGARAASVARSLNARAFTVGRNITFGAGQYSPSSHDGKRLLAHELTHVLQQGGHKSR